MRVIAFGGNFGHKPGKPPLAAIYPLTHQFRMIRNKIGIDFSSTELRMFYNFVEKWNCGFYTAYDIFLPSALSIMPIVFPNHGHRQLKGSGRIVIGWKFVSGSNIEIKPYARATRRNIP